MSVRYPKPVHDFVKKLAPVLTDHDLVLACNEVFGTAFTADRMKSFRGNHGYRGGDKKVENDLYWKYQTYYPKGLYEYVRDHSKGVSARKMAVKVNEIFGLTWTEVDMKRFRYRYGIKSGVTGRFEKGHISDTKGKTIEEICKHDPEKIARAKASQFKKGNRPANALPIGTIVTNYDGYKLIKMQMHGGQWERWKFLHRVVWEEHNGPIPKGMVVGFKDGNRANCEPANLLLMSKEENSAMTGFHYRFNDPDLTETALGVVRLKHAGDIARRKKHGKQAAKMDTV